MAATPPAIRVITPHGSSAPDCPTWCREHLTSPPSALLHRCDLGESWGPSAQRDDEDKISLVLERHDDDGVAGEPYLSLRYLTDGRHVDHVVDIPLPDAESMLFSALGLVARGRSEQGRYFGSAA